MTQPALRFAPLKIYGWGPDHHGGGQYRIGLPMWALRLTGHDASAFSVMEGEIPEDVDVVVAQLLDDEARSGPWRELAQRPGRRPVLILELDHDLWNVHRTNFAAMTSRTPEVLARLEDNIRMADAVTVTTPHLAEFVKRFNPHVFVLPNCIDLNLIAHQRTKAKRLTVGWAGGSSHADDFASMNSSLRQFLRRHTEVDMHFVGPDYRQVVNLPNIRWSPWSTNLVDYLRLLDFDIGLAPLAYHRFNKSKSDIKVLEYAALGIPVVASDFGPYAESVIHGETGFLVRRPHEWGRYLGMLAEDVALREQMSVNAKLWATSRTVQGNAGQWELAYRQTIARVHGEQRMLASAVSAVSA